MKTLDMKTGDVVAGTLLNLMAAVSLFPICLADALYGLADSRVLKEFDTPLKMHSRRFIGGAMTLLGFPDNYFSRELQQQINQKLIRRHVQ